MQEIGIKNNMALHSQRQHHQPCVYTYIGARFNMAEMATRAFEIRMAAQGTLVLLIGVVAVDGAKTKAIEFMACLLTQNIVPDTYVHFQRYSNDQCVK